MENVGGSIMNEKLVNICIDQFNKTIQAKVMLYEVIRATWKLKKPVNMLSARSHYQAVQILISIPLSMVSTCYARDRG